MRIGRIAAAAATAAATALLVAAAAAPAYAQDENDGLNILLDNNISIGPVEIRTPVRLDLDLG